MSRVNRRIAIRIVRFCRSTNDVLTKRRIRVAHNRVLDRADALGRAVAARASVVRGENLIQHRVVGVEIDHLDGLQISLVAVCGELDAIGEPRLEIAHERYAGVLAAIADVPRNDQLGIRVDGGPRPNVARAFWRGSWQTLRSCSWRS